MQLGATRRPNNGKWRPLVGFGSNERAGSPKSLIELDAATAACLPGILSRTLPDSAIICTALEQLVHQCQTVLCGKDNPLMEINGFQLATDSSAEG